MKKQGAAVPELVPDIRALAAMLGRRPSLFVANPA
jgi:hypothetical protein